MIFELGELRLSLSSLPRSFLLTFILSFLIERSLRGVFPTLGEKDFSGFVAILLAVDSSLASLTD